MTKKHVQERMARMREIGEREAKSRCAHGNCRKPLGRIAEILAELTGGERFCSYECQEAELAYRRAKEART